VEKAPLTFGLGALFAFQVVQNLHGVSPERGTYGWSTQGSFGRSVMEIWNGFHGTSRGVSDAT
jgi:hypothetical protein